jgi:hypothetical protein
MQKPIQAEKSSSEDDLLKQGWTKQFLASGTRLREATESYAALGFEVHLEAAQAKVLACSGCQPPQPSAAVEGWYVIYTRLRRDRGGARGEDELW